MKPYTLLCEHSESDDITYGLYERDGIKYYQVNTQPVSSSKEVNCEHELAFMMSRPFKPAKQPKFLVIGLGVGGYLNALAEALPQKKAIFEVLDLNSKSGSWFKEHLVEESSTIGRTEFITNKVVSYVKSKSDQYHGIFFDPELWRSFGNKEDLMSKPYLNYFVNALKMGGLLGMITERSDKIVLGRMERSGLEVRTERFSAVPGGKRQRTIWLAKKGHYVKQRDAERAAKEA